LHKHISELDVAQNLNITVYSNA